MRPITKAGSLTWPLGVSSKDVALIVSVMTEADRQAVEYQSRLKGLPGLVHVSVEVHPCDAPDCPCA